MSKSFTSNRHLIAYICDTSDEIRQTPQPHAHYANTFLILGKRTAKLLVIAFIVTCNEQQGSQAAERIGYSTHGHSSLYIHVRYPENSTTQHRANGGWCDFMCTISRIMCLCYAELFGSKVPQCTAVVHKRRSKCQVMQCFVMECRAITKLSRKRVPAKLNLDNESCIKYRTSSSSWCSVPVAWT